MIVKIIHLSAIPVLIYASWQKNRLFYRQLVSARAVESGIAYNKVSAAAAGVLMLSGLAMLFWGDKPSSLYFSHPLFWMKMVLFVTLSAMVVSTRKWMRTKMTGERHLDIPVPKRVQGFLLMDLIGMFLLLMLGYVIANY